MIDNSEEANQVVENVGSRWLSVFSFGESWHNNHHAFESSARQGLEWWQIDISWYIVRFLEIIGLATDVKLPSESQRRRMALVR